MNMNLSPFTYTYNSFDSESPVNGRGAILQGLKCTTIKTNSSNYAEGVAFEVLAGEVYESDGTVYVNGKQYRYQRARVRCRVSDNQSFMKTVGNMYGKHILFHSKKIAGVCETVCVTENQYIDIIVIMLTESINGGVLRLESSNMRFVLINDTNSLDTVSDIPITEVTEVSNEATYGDSRIVYNREVNYQITFAMRKERAEKYYGAYTNSNFAYINPFNPEEAGDQPILLNSVNSSGVTDEDGTMLVKDFKTARTFFILAPETKSMTFRGNAYYLDIKVPLI